MVPTLLLRTIDAALNRACEGLRVVEDYLRFELSDAHLTQLAKSLRHELAEAVAGVVASADRHASRDTLHDVGTQITTQGEQQRTDTWAVCAANLKRVEQSLRSLEEYGKLIDQSLGGQMEGLRYRVYTLEKAIDITRLSRERLEEVRLCVLVDGSDEGLITTLVEAGVGMIQLRDKRLDDRQLVARAQLLVRLTRQTQTLAIVNNRPDIALLAQADGVHVGQEDLSVCEARAIVGPRMLVGVSTHTIEQARQAVLDGANYLGAGPTFPSKTKSFDTFPGLKFLRQVASEISLPTFAIGGIDAQNCEKVLATGVSRVAVGAAVVSAHSPNDEVKKLNRCLSAVTC